ncbi:hypothetical protein G195_007048 [Phytophthora kernoviae 00238/432]|uniref:Uncharacterized protein n=1 Tax=Phytophthora kernoviae 00238/432 TaxID=1284355 RepID=A0A8J4RYF2_9STRA|nr:hypothetical protein G195_007048 [Phytophthora kernoviae 00238/432]
MKREAVFPVDTDANTTSDDWGSGAAAILDDVMWDEESDLSPPQTGALISPMDIVCSASPVNSPAGRVYTLDRSGGGGISPICGDESPIDKVDGPRWAQQFQQPSLGGEEVLRMQLDKMDELDASEELGYHALSDLDLTHVILENQRTIGRVQSRLFVPSSLDTEGGTRTRRMQTFGWDMVQRVDGNIMECVFTKKFHGLNVAGLMQKTWANDMRLGEFKKVKGETCRLEVLQQVNPNAYVLCRDVMSPTQDISIFRSVFVRFLIETSKKISASSGVSSSGTGIDASAPSTPPQYAESDSDCEELMLEATGYVLGTQSVDTDHSRHPRAEDMFNKVAWAHLSLSIEFLNVVNPVTGEEYQQLCWSGRTNYCGPEHAQRNASDMLQGMLRWELLIIAPALNLCSLR